MPNLNLSLGPMLIGTFMNMILYGVLIVQTAFYIQTYKKDALWIKYLVLYLFILETINTGCDIAMMYQPLITDYGRPLINFPLMFASEPILIVAISTPIQLFFAWRIRVLSKMIILPCIICLLALVSLAGGTWTTVKLVIIKLFSRKPELHEPALIWFLSSCIADVAITTVLVYTLSKRKTGFAATDDAVSKIIRMTVQTGLLTALFAIGDVVFFMTLPRTALNFLWDLALSKLYSNCLLSTLNARASLNNVSSRSNRGLPITSSDTASSGRKPNDGFAELGHLEPNSASGFKTSFLELDQARKSTFEGTSSYIQRDVDYGITVTKVVETDQPPQAYMGYAQ